MQCQPSCNCCRSRGRTTRDGSKMLLPICADVVVHRNSNFWPVALQVLAGRMSLPTKVLRIADQGKRPSSVGERRQNREHQLQRAYGSKAANERPKDVLKRFGVSQRLDSELAGQSAYELPPSGSSSHPRLQKEKERTFSSW